ncbi:MAG: hypothetical protein KC420_07715, partial [Myxococcales bacterium]|nr:hypothetical protein [Myxococcales bacterium]
DLFLGETFDEAAAAAIVDERVASATRLQKAVARALGEIHGLLGAAQRSKLATLIRTGMLSI